MTMFSDPKYETVKLFLNQIVMSVFGLVTAVATSGSVPLAVICSVLGIGLYIFLIYNMMWEIGAKDRIRADAGRYEYKAVKPFKMSLIASIPNFVLGLAGALSLIDSPATAAIADVGFNGCKLILGQYLGLARLTGTLSNPFAWLGFACVGVLFPVLGYNAGYRGFSLIPALHRPKKQK